MKKVLIASVVLSLMMLTVMVMSSCSQKEKPLENSSMDDLIKSEAETAISMLQAVYKKHELGDISFEKAQDLGAFLLRELSYGADGYFWADTEEGVNVVLYGSDIEGTNRLESQDSHGNYYIKEFIEKAMEGGGYIEYYFPKKAQSEEQHKRSYVLHFEPFGWIIGTGYYL